MEKLFGSVYKLSKPDAKESAYSRRIENRFYVRFTSKNSCEYYGEV